jgi:hypothetical protein
LLSHRIHIPLFIPKCVLFQQHRAGFRKTEGGMDGAQQEKQWVDLSDAEQTALAGVTGSQALVETWGQHSGKVTPEWVEIPFKEGETFEVNNIIKHQVQQTGPFDRVTMIIDLMDKPCSKYLDVMPECVDWTSPGCYKQIEFSKAAWRGESEFEELK